MVDMMTGYLSIVHLKEDLHRKDDFTAIFPIQATTNDGLSTDIAQPFRSVIQVS